MSSNFRYIEVTYTFPMPKYLWRLTLKRMNIDTFLSIRKKF